MSTHSFFTSSLATPRRLRDVQEPNPRSRTMRTRQHVSKACRSRRNGLIGVAIGLSFLTLQPPPAGAQEIVPKFKYPEVFQVGVEPFGLAVADLTGGPGGAPDGYPDLAVANEFDGTVTFFVNTRDWTPVSDG